MKVRIALAALAVAFLNVAMLAPFAEAATPASVATAPSAAPQLPVTSTVTDALGHTVGTFSGTLTLDHFANQNGQLVAVGTLTGTVTNLVGGVLNTITNLAVTLPVTNTQGTCDILHLELGPIDLNVLGLMIHLDKVVLDISASAGSGNLLGNLLCAVTHLLDHGAPLGGLAALLNRILALL